MWCGRKTCTATQNSSPGIGLVNVDIACKSLGLTGGERVSADNLPQNGEYPNHNGNWSVLSGFYCDASADSGNAFDGARLVDGNTVCNTKVTFKGVVHVHHDNRWKSVCNLGMSQDIARSMCSHLGKTGGKLVSGTEKQGEQSWAKLIECPVGANRISKCIEQELDATQMDGCKEVNIECDNEAYGDL